MHHSRAARARGRRIVRASAADDESYSYSEAPEPPPPSSPPPPPPRPPPPPVQIRCVPTLAHGLPSLLQTATATTAADSAFDNCELGTGALIAAHASAWHASQQLRPTRATATSASTCCCTSALQDRHQPLPLQWRHHTSVHQPCSPVGPHARPQRHSHRLRRVHGPPACVERTRRLRINRKADVVAVRPTVASARAVVEDRRRRWQTSCTTGGSTRRPETPRDIRIACTDRDCHKGCRWERPAVTTRIAAPSAALSVCDLVSQQDPSARTASLSTRAALSTRLLLCLSSTTEGCPWRSSSSQARSLASPRLGALRPGPQMSWRGDAARIHGGWVCSAVGRRALWRQPIPRRWQRQAPRLG